MTVIRTLFLTLLLAMAFIPSVAMQVSDREVRDALVRLDNEMTLRNLYLDRRQSAIDSLCDILAKGGTANHYLELGDLYTSYHNDSAIIVYTKGIYQAEAENDALLALKFKLRRATLLPLGGLMKEALEEYTAIDSTSLPPGLLDLYFDAGRQMYSYMGAFYPTFTSYHSRYDSLSLQAQEHLLSHLDERTPKYKLNAGEYYFRTGDFVKSEALLRELLQSIGEDDNMYARGAHILSSIAMQRGKNNDYLYYLIVSAIADIKSATLEVTSLQDLGQVMFQNNEVERAHRYLYAALSNAVECRAINRMLQASESMPLVESVHQSELSASRRRIYVGVAVLAIALIAAIVSMMMLRRQMAKQQLLRAHLEETNRIKEVYISQFLNLCSIYMDKLNQFCKIANRKISTGKVDDLYKMTKSGKFVENQSKEFYEVFDNAFLHIYPGFVDSVNRLLRDDEQIVLKDGELLNTDLRILAFMRLGIEESTRIAQILNYSVYTIYTYRNRMKNRAISRDTFEADIMAIGN